jgi:hypothetical protein
MMHSNFGQQVQCWGDCERIFHNICREVDRAKTPSLLAELYRHAGNLVMLFESPVWESKFGKDVAIFQEAGNLEFRTVARRLNQRAKQIGLESNFNEMAHKS